MEILKDIKDISFVHLTTNDVVRNPLVKQILQAYENEEGKE
jgi:phosphate starvation-inducible PhoH-like protein